MSKQRTLQEVSRDDWNIAKPSLENLQIGALLRIADALEEISDNNARMLSVMKEIRDGSKT